MLLCPLLICAARSAWGMSISLFSLGGGIPLLCAMVRNQPCRSMCAFNDKFGAGSLFFSILRVDGCVTYVCASG